MVQIQFGKIVTGIARQKIRQDIFFNGGERTERLQVADSSAIAFRIDPFGPGDALVGNQDVAQFSAESVFALHHVAVEDYAAAVAGSDYD